MNIIRGGSFASKGENPLEEKEEKGIWNKSRKERRAFFAQLKRARRQASRKSVRKAKRDAPATPVGVDNGL